MKYEIMSTEQIKKIYDNPEILKQWFPIAFRIRHEIGKWYCIDDVYSLFCVTSIENDLLYGYGFDRGKYFNYSNEKGVFCACNSAGRERARPATPEEVEKALINEAEKRGFKKGVKYISPNGTFTRIINTPFYLSDDMESLCCNDSSIIMNNGKWAEIIKETEIELTLDEIAEKFGVDKVKIKK